MACWCATHRRIVTSTHQSVDGFWHLRQREVIIQKMPIIYSCSAQLKAITSSCMSLQTQSPVYSESPQSASRDASLPTRVVKRLFLDVSTGRLFTEEMFIYSSGLWAAVICYRTWSSYVLQTFLPLTNATSLHSGEDGGLSNWRVARFSCSVGCMLAESSLYTITPISNR